MYNAIKNRYILTLIIKEALNSNRLEKEVQYEICRNIKLKTLNRDTNNT